MNNNEMIPALETVLTQKMHALNRYVSEPNRFNVSIRQDELFEKQQSVIFLFKITAKYCYLEFCCPLTAEQRNRLDAVEYTPVLRSGKYLKIGTDVFMDNHYAYANIRFPLDSGALDFIAALEYLHNELESFLRMLEPIT